MGKKSRKPGKAGGKGKGAKSKESLRQSKLAEAKELHLKALSSGGEALAIASSIKEISERTAMQELEKFLFPLIVSEYDYLCRRAYGRRVLVHAVLVTDPKAELEHTLKEFNTEENTLFRVEFRPYSTDPVREGLKFYLDVAVKSGEYTIDSLRKHLEESIHLSILAAHTVELKEKHKKPELGKVYDVEDGGSVRFGHEKIDARLIPLSKSFAKEEINRIAAELEFMALVEKSDFFAASLLFRRHNLHDITTHTHELMLGQYSSLLAFTYLDAFGITDHKNIVNIARLFTYKGVEEWGSTPRAHRVASRVTGRLTSIVDKYKTLVFEVLSTSTSRDDLINGAKKKLLDASAPVINLASEELEDFQLYMCEMKSPASGIVLNLDKPLLEFVNSKIKTKAAAQRLFTAYQRFDIEKIKSMQVLLQSSVSEARECIKKCLYDTDVILKKYVEFCSEIDNLKETMFLAMQSLSLVESGSRDSELNEEREALAAIRARRYMTDEEISTSIRVSADLEKLFDGFRDAAKEAIVSIRVEAKRVGVLVDEIERIDLMVINSLLLKAVEIKRRLPDIVCSIAADESTVFEDGFTRSNLREMFTFKKSEERAVAKPKICPPGRKKRFKSISYCISKRAFEYRELVDRMSHESIRKMISELRCDGDLNTLDHLRYVKDNLQVLDGADDGAAVGSSHFITKVNDYISSTFTRDSFESVDGVAICFNIVRDLNAAKHSLLDSVRSTLELARKSGNVSLLAVDLALIEYQRAVSELDSRCTEDIFSSVDFANDFSKAVAIDSMVFSEVINYILKLSYKVVNERVLTGLLPNLEDLERLEGYLKPDVFASLRLIKNGPKAWADFLTMPPRDITDLKGALDVGIKQFEEDLRRISMADAAAVRLAEAARSSASESSSDSIISTKEDLLDKMNPEVLLLLAEPKSRETVLEFLTNLIPEDAADGFIVKTNLEAFVNIFGDGVFESADAANHVKVKLGKPLLLSRVFEVDPKTEGTTISFAHSGRAAGRTEGKAQCARVKRWLRDQYGVEPKLLLELLSSGMMPAPKTVEDSAPALSMKG